MLSLHDVRKNQLGDSSQRDAYSARPELGVRRELVRFLKSEAFLHQHMIVVVSGEKFTHAANGEEQALQAVELRRGHLQ